MNWLDGAIALVAPRAALERTRARAALKAHRRGYEGAAQGRGTDGWRTGATSADAEIAAAGPRLRDRARDLTRNNPYAARALSAWVTNLVGEGITPSANSGVDKLDRQTMQAFADWSAECAADGAFDFFGLQGLIVREMIEGGDVLARRRWRRVEDGFAIPLQVQVLEADFLDSSRTGPQQNGNMAIEGIEFDLRGQRTAYWLWSQHPGNTFLSYGTHLFSSAVPASEILHLYESQRVQVRGVPWVTPAIRRHRDLDDYQFAEGIRKKIESSMVGVVIGDDEEDGINPADEATGARVVDGRGNLLERFAPGMFAYLRGGKDIKFNQPAAVSGYADYEATALRAIASGWRLPYELITGDLSKVNFSSARLGLMEFRRLVRMLQWQLIIPVALDPLWAWFCEAAYLAGRIPQPYVPVQWSPPKFDWINPVDDVRAALIAMRAGLRSPQEILLESGRDPKELVAEFKAWFAMVDGADLVFDNDVRAVSQAGLAQTLTPGADAAQP